MEQFYSLRESAGRFLATAGLLVLASAFVFTACDTTVNEEGDPVSVSDTTDASTTINNPPPGPYDVTGNVTGRVVDKATNEPLANVAVTIDAVDAEEGQPLSDTTNDAGEFAFTNVPAQTSQDEASSPPATGDYSIYFNTEATSGNYEDNVRVEATLEFGNQNTQDGSDGSDGDPNNLGASVTLPLPELAGSIQSKAYVRSDVDNERIPASGIPVALERNIGLEYSASGNAVQTNRVQTAVTTTNADGSFSFDEVPEGLNSGNYFFVWTLGDSKVQFSTNKQNVPLASAGNPSVTLPPQNVTSPVKNNFPFQLLSAPEVNDPDFNSTTPSLTFVFNRGVAQNDFTTESNLEEELDLDFDQRKTLDEDDGSPTLDVTFSANRDTMTITPTESLDDGTEYILRDIRDIFTNNKFVGAPFELDEEVPPGVPNPNSAAFNNFLFSVGADQTKPGAPRIVPTDLDGDNIAVESSGKTDSLDYTDTFVRIEHRIVDTSSVKLCKDCGPFELWASSEGESFDQPFNGTGQFGEVELSPTLGSDPFQASNQASAATGSYVPVKVFAKVQSLNEVKSGRSDVLTLEDNETIELVSAFYDNRDSDPDEDVLVVNFDEPVKKSSVDVGDFTINETGGGSPSQLGSIQNIDNSDSGGPTNNGSATVTITVTTDNSADDELVVDGLTDLAGNGVNGATNTDSSL